MESNVMNRPGMSDDVKTKRYTISKDIFARYKYTTDRVELFTRRGHSIAPEYFSNTKFGNVKCVLFCEQSGNCSEFFTNICKEIKKESRTINQREGIVVERSHASDKPQKSSRTAERRNETLQPSLSIIHTRCCRPNSDTIQQNSSELILLTDDNKRSIHNFKKDYASSMICVTSYEDLKKNINLLLERYACGKLRDIVDKLNTDRNETGGTRHPKPTVGTPSRRALSQGAATNTPPTNGCRSDLYDESGKKLDMCSAKRKSESETTEGLRSGKRFKPTAHTESSRNKLDTFLLDVMALFKRSDVPKSEWPKMQQPNPKTTPLKLRIVDELFKIDSTIVGCGYRHHILQIYLNREANVSLDFALTKALNKHDLVHHNFNYGPCKYTECCGIKVGSHLGTQTVSATLGGFARANEKLYALVTRHFTTMARNCIKHKRSDGQFVAIATHRGRLEGDLDIAAARILPGTNITDTRFRDSIGRFTRSMLFNFEGQTDERKQQIKDALQSEYIFAWTAQSVSRPSRGMITIPDFQRPIYQHNFVLIESEQDEYADQSFGKRGDSGAIVCFDDRDGNGVHVVSMFMGELRFGDTDGLVSLPLQQGLQQINANFGGVNLQLC